jgi:proteasome accessory factor B
MRVPNVCRITRLLKVLQLLQSGRGSNINALARANEVSRRTAFRDIQALRDAGVDVSYDEQRDRYSLPSARFVPLDNLTEDETTALVLLASEIGREGRLPFCEPARSAAAKLLSLLPLCQRQRIRAAMRSVRIYLSPACQRIDVDTFKSLVTASSLLREVQFQYSNGTGGPKTLVRLQPYHLVYFDRRLMAVGYSPNGNQVASFELDRIEAVRYTSRTFEIPNDFSLENFLSNGTWIRSPWQEPIEVAIRIEGQDALRAIDSTGRIARQIEFQHDGAILLRVTVTDLGEITSWILSLGPRAEVIAPMSLRESVARTAEEIANRYSTRNQLRIRRGEAKAIS